MATFTGTAADEFITPTQMSGSVVASPIGSNPTNANDIINAGGGSDTIDSSGGNDTVAGQQGNDIAQLGAGTDTFIWNPGDGNDTVDGGAGTDTLDFFGTGAAENIGLTPNGSRLRFFRDVGLVTLDAINVEKVIFHALGGADTISVSDLSATHVLQVTVNLEGSIGSGTGDGQSDFVYVYGGGVGNVVNISGSGGSIAIAGLPCAIAVNTVEATDSLRIFGEDGDDTISAKNLATLVSLVVDGGNGNDTITGSSIADSINSGNGNDVVTGFGGSDVAILGAGSDRFIWNPGDGSDIVEGQGQTDTLEFNGANANENFELAANGGRSVLTRDVASVVMDMDDVEKLVINAGGGINNFIVGNMAGTDLVAAITYIGGAAVDTVDAGVAFNDMIVTGGGSADNLAGGNGDDTFRYLAASDAIASEIINGRAGIGDTLQLVNTGSIDFRPLSIFGVERLQFLSGSSSATFLSSQIGGAGIESVTGGAGSDGLIVTGDSFDLSPLVFSGWTDATDRITLVGSAAVSVLTGSVRGDILNGGGGADTMAGGAGNDSYYVNDAGDKTIEGSGGGSDTVFTTVNYALAAGQQIEVFGTASLTGTTTITLTGNEFAQRINGNNGNNVLYGGAGNDRLVGYAGNDNLEGQAGLDTLKGVTGADKFVFRYSTITTAGADHIADFGSDDVIYIDHPSVTGPLNPAGFVAGANALDANDRFIYYAPNKALYFDPDGNGATAKVLFAVFDNGYAPTAADIILF